MAQAVSTSVTRRSVVAGLALTTPVALAGADKAYAQAKQPTAETSDKSLYERLGGIFAIAAVVDHFSDAVVKNPVAGQKSKNPVGRRRSGWAIRIQRHQTRQDAAWP